MIDQKTIKRQLDMLAGHIETLQLLMQYGQFVGPDETVISHRELSEQWLKVPPFADNHWSDKDTIDISQQHRRSILEDTGKKPARVLLHFDRFPHPAEADSFGNLFAGTEIALRNMDCVRAYIPPAYSKELVIESLKDIIKFVERDWDRLSAEATEDAKGLHCSEAERQRLALPEVQSDGIPF